jgi:hypothetical protein
VVAAGTSRAAQRRAQKAARMGVGVVLKTEMSDVLSLLDQGVAAAAKTDPDRAANQGFTGPRRDALVESSPNTGGFAAKGVAAGVLRRGVP